MAQKFVATTLTIAALLLGNPALAQDANPTDQQPNSDVAGYRVDD